MSFSSQAKDELMRLKMTHRGCLIGELSAIAQATGTIVIKRGGASFDIKAENSALARRIFGCVRQLCGAKMEIYAKENPRLNKNRIYIVSISGEEREQLLELLELVGTHGAMWRGVPDAAEKSCCKRAFVRGLFLACGSMTDPEKEYHLEMVIKSRALAEETVVLLATMGIHARITERREDNIVYIKGADDIGDLLTMMGASSSLLKHENVRIKKQMRNSVNRVVNCETANLSRTVNAAVRQCGAIRYLMDRGEFLSLPPELISLAVLRLENPEASIAELAEIMGDITRSGVNHRLRKLAETAEALGYEDEELTVKGKRGGVS